MQFQVGDQVVHASHGNGQVVAIEEKRLSGDGARLFYAVATSRGTVWVPVDAEGASSLRLLVSKDGLAHCRALLKSRPAILNADRRQRYLELSDRLQRASFEVMCEVVRDLTAHSWPKPLSDADASTLRRVREDVCREWALASDVSQLEASREITALLKEGRQVYNT